MNHQANLLQNLLNGGQHQHNLEDFDIPITDTAEQIYISSLSLLKMLKHARAGVPLEVMGLMLGEFVDEYTIKVVDVFAMPQSGTGVSVEAVDPVFQQQMLDMLKQTQRQEMVVGWYHSHPSFGCWLSSIDQNTQQSFEMQHPRCVAVVIDPIQSVKGKVVMDAFRLIKPELLQMNKEPRQTTSNQGLINPPGIQALYHGLNKYYYSININYRKNELETKMLLNLYKDKWSNGMKVKDAKEHSEHNQEMLKSMCTLSQNYQKWIEEESKISKDQQKIRNVGKIDPKRHLEEDLNDLMSSNIVQTMGVMVNTKAF